MTTPFNLAKAPAEMTVEQFVWLTAWCSVASANDCKDAKTAANWADSCLSRFRDTNFNKQ